MFLLPTLSSTCLTEELTLDFKALLLIFPPAQADYPDLREGLQVQLSTLSSSSPAEENTSTSQGSEGITSQVILEIKSYSLHSDNPAAACKMSAVT